MVAVIVQQGQAHTVVVTRQTAVATVAPAPAAVQITNRESVAAIERETNVVGVASTGIQGPTGALSGTTDQLLEGTENLYYTAARAQTEAMAAAAAALSMHLADPDPHPQYQGDADILDGGNF